MSMIPILLDTGRTVFVDGVYCQLTYQSLEMGHPRKELNDEIIRGLLGRVGQLWLNVPVRIADMRDVDVLPKYFIAALAFSMEPARDKTKDASQLVVGWFSPTLPFVADVVREAFMNRLPWEEYAQDYDC